MRMRLCGLVIITLGILLCGCAEPNPARPDEIPDPSSALVDAFRWEQDGDYAYAMLRPDNWNVTDTGISRGYYPDPQPADGRVLVSAVNYIIEDGKEESIDVHWRQFEEQRKLDAWAEAVIHTLWQGNFVQLEQELDNARIYSIRSGENHLRLVAYKIDRNQPLVIMLEGGGEFSDMRRLRDAGIWDDFLVMVGSARAAPARR